ncbi:MAG: hypothetical protein HQM16_09100 [Deltaproteobacteria bacterium]|nr:hypothetical protein [Deltaproteobacteria bacterium]
MTFNFEKLFTDVFAPQKGEVVTVMCDEPHHEIKDNAAWQDRRIMAQEWHSTIKNFSGKYGITVNPLVVYPATGSKNRDLPEYVTIEGKNTRSEDLIAQSTIVISMPEFSATAPLLNFTQKYKKLRVASMPCVQRSMEATGLSADYSLVAKKCALLAPLFKKACGIEVTFSTGHKCFFDITPDNLVFEDSGNLHPDKKTMRLANLPSGEVCKVPNEAPDSKTQGEIPAQLEGEDMVFVVQHNHIIDVKGDGPTALKMKQAFAEKALSNIAEVAIGCNDKAKVIGVILEDEKAGFHWAYGRSDHIGGTIGVKDFSAPDKVCHTDIIYAKESPIVCKQFDFVFADNTRKTAIVDGELLIC